MPQLRVITGECAIRGNRERVLVMLDLVPRIAVIAVRIGMVPIVTNIAIRMSTAMPADSVMRMGIVCVIPDLRFLVTGALRISTATIAIFLALLLQLVTEMEPVTQKENVHASPDFQLHIVIPAS
jgi:hypothetical protein